MERAAGWTRLSQLIGVWKGSGRGEFPTIEPFTYREVFEVTEAVAGQSLHYRQWTWRTSVDPEAISHIETGFINLAPEAGVEILNAQGTDRVELLSGSMERTMVGFNISLRSKSIVGDDRMIASWREWQLAADGFSYSMGMSTGVVPDGAHHLSAELRRQEG